MLDSRAGKAAKALQLEYYLQHLKLETLEAILVTDYLNSMKVGLVFAMVT